ncbi:unnamed protein product, partial [Ilex paraguariensis]
KKYGVKSSWTRMSSIDSRTAEWWSCWLYQPISQLQNGPLLMFLNRESALIYYDTKKKEWRYLKIYGIKSNCEAVAHIPSFISLKDAVIGNSGVVLNINSRCARFKLQGETKALLLVEEDWKMELNWDSYCSSYSEENDVDTGGRGDAAENQA